MAQKQNQGFDSGGYRLCCPYCLTPISSERPGLARLGENPVRWYYTACDHPAVPQEAVWRDTTTPAPGGMVTS